MNRPVFLLVAAGTAAAGAWLSWSWFHGHNTAEIAAASSQSPHRRRPVQYLPASEDFQAMPVRVAPPAAVAAQDLPVAGLEYSQPRWQTAGASSDQEALLTREQLEFRALKVEQEANHELATLIPALNLTDEEQDRVFIALAKKSDYYHPALQLQNAAGGALESSAPAASSPSASAAPGNSRAPSSATPSDSLALNDGSSPSDPVSDALPVEKRDTYQQLKADREAFWVSVVERLQSQIATGSTKSR